MSDTPETSASPAPVTVLLVEDNEVDVEAVRRAFRRHRIANPIKIARDGIEALAVLRGNGDYALARPYIVILDLNMPRMNGIEFLQELRSDPQLHDTVVFVLTTSSSDRDLVASYELHVAGYMVKSEVGEDFVKFTRMLENYWHVVVLPPNRT